MSSVAPWASEHDNTWQVTLTTLRSEGWQAELTCFAAPVQVEGRLPTGEHFYFRARHNEVSLAVGGADLARSPDPADSPRWRHAEQHDDASHLAAGDGLAILRRLVKRYAEQSPQTGTRPQPMEA